MTTPNLVDRGDDGEDSVIVTHRLNNRPPVLSRKLRKIAIVAGKALRWRIPEDTFRDAEDGNTRSLRLSLRYQNGSVLDDAGSWIRFDRKTQEVWIMPVESDISRWRYQLIAEDRQGQSASDWLEVVVRQFSGSRLLNHEFEVAFSFTGTVRPALLRKWEWMVNKENLIYM